MLVLTRKQNEKIRIGENITITVIRMKGKAVRLGIEAPRNVNVLRGELLFDAASDKDAADIHCESGHCESGHCESGHCESGHCESGHCESSHCEDSKGDQAAEDTIIECRILRSEHEQFAI